MTKTPANRKKARKPVRQKGAALGARATAWMRQNLAASVAITALLSIGLTVLAPRAYAAFVARSNDTAAQQMAGRHFALPSGERPAVLTVTNANSIGIPFLDGAEEGDKLLVYQENQLAVLYRPSADKIITVGPLTDE